MDGGDCDEHDARDSGSTERCEQTERQQRSSTELGQARDRSVQASRPEPHRIEPAAGAGEAGTAEPPEQLLSAVRSHGQAEHDSHEQETSRHLSSPFAVGPSREPLAEKLARASNYSRLGSVSSAPKAADPWRSWRSAGGGGWAA